MNEANKALFDASKFVASGKDVQTKISRISDYVSFDEYVDLGLERKRKCSVDDISSDEEDDGNSVENTDRGMKLKEIKVSPFFLVFATQSLKKKLQPCLPQHEQKILWKYFKSCIDYAEEEGLPSLTKPQLVTKSKTKQAVTLPMEQDVTTKIEVYVNQTPR
ncbi:hypothetical protein G9A89_010264 [Geosiphon pyriformis]|nr:hypothetical protein G9A89_010264 [Geosiphon pyriformis]